MSETATAKKVYTIGLASIEVGDIPEGGGMATSLDTLGYTYQDTCKMTQEDPEETDHYAEELDDPVVSTARGGKTNFAFSIMNPSVTVLAKLLGGTADVASNSWTAPAKVPKVEKSVRITPEQGLKFEVPRMKLTSKINADFSKKGILLIEVAGKVMQPEDSTEGKMKATLITTASSDGQ